MMEENLQNSLLSSKVFSIGSADEHSFPVQLLHHYVVLKQIMKMQEMRYLFNMLYILRVIAAPA
jgi:hypothetical protein